MRKRYVAGAAAVLGVLAVAGCATDEATEVATSQTVDAQPSLPDGLLPEDAMSYAINEALDHDVGVHGVEQDSASGGYVVLFLGDHDQTRIDRAREALAHLDVPLAFEFVGDIRVVDLDVADP